MRLCDVTDGPRVRRAGREQKERRSSTSVLEIENTSFSVRRRGGRNFSCNADYREHYLLIANPMAYVCMCVCVYIYVLPLRGSGAERHARANATAR